MAGWMAGWVAGCRFSAETAGAGVGEERAECWRGGSRAGILGGKERERGWGIERGLKREAAWWEGEQSIPGAPAGGLGVDIEGQG